MIIPDYSNDNRNDQQQQRAEGEGNQNRNNFRRQSRRIGTYARQFMTRHQTNEEQQQPIVVNQLSEEDIKRRALLKQSILRGIICFIIPIAILTLYSIFLKSYFTAFYVLFTGLLIVFTFENFYKNPKMPSSDNKNDLKISLLNEEKVELVDFRIYLWILGTLVTFSLFIFKLVVIIYFNVHDNQMPFNASNNVLYDLEIYIVDTDGQSWQNILKMFVPTTFLLINCIVVFIFRAPKKYLTFQEIKVHKKRSNLINFCKSLVWICLIGAQAFNVSLQAYIFYFIFVISLTSLFFPSKIKNFFDEYIKHLIKVVCLGILFLQFLCTTKTFRDSIQGSNWSFNILGLNLITDFDNSLTVPISFNKFALCA